MPRKSDAVVRLVHADTGRGMPPKQVRGQVHLFPPQQLLPGPRPDPAEVEQVLSAIQNVPEAHRPTEKDVRTGWLETCLPPWDDRYPSGNMDPT